jgi:hypothetical protein
MSKAAPDKDLLAAAALAFVEPFGGMIRIEIDEGGAFEVDGRGAAPHVAAAKDRRGDALAAASGDGFRAGHCLWRASRDTLMRIFEEERFLTNSYVSGRLVIAGDMSVMARLKLKGTPS